MMNPDENTLLADWSESLDDLTSEYWDAYLGGPDDDHFEPDTTLLDEPCCEDDGQAPSLPEEEGCDEPMHAESNTSEARRKAIVQWLSTSRLARPLRSADGFFVLRGMYGRLADGTVVDVLEWLFEEDLLHGTVAGDYSLAYTAPGERYREKLTFFRIVETIPFARAGNGKADHEDQEFYPF